MVKENGIYAGIVSYNPDIQRIRENILSISNQVLEILVFDNGSKNILELKKLIDEFQNVYLLESSKNIGIAAALNRLMQWGLEHDYVWMLSLDQDSVCSEDYVDKMKPYLYAESDFGVVAPVIVDRNVGIVGHNPKLKYGYVNTCITSGAFSKISIWKAIGEYDEKMFIDSVDFEYCYRVRKAGFKVIQVRDVTLLHELGDSSKKRVLFWKITVQNHSAFRKYYIAQNNVYYPLKHKLWLHFIRGNIRNINQLVMVFVFENNKIEKCRNILAGWRNAFIMYNTNRM